MLIIFFTIGRSSTAVVYLNLPPVVHCTIRSITANCALSTTHHGKLLLLVRLDRSLTSVRTMNSWESEVWRQTLQHEGSHCTALGAYRFWKGKRRPHVPAASLNNGRESATDTRFLPGRNRQSEYSIPSLSRRNEALFESSRRRVQRERKARRGSEGSVPPAEAHWPVESLMVHGGAQVCELPFAQLRPIPLVLTVRALCHQRVVVTSIGHMRSTGTAARAQAVVGCSARRISDGARRWSAAPVCHIICIVGTQCRRT
eukprot:SAG31_NODE_349_length_17243_cov_7.408248_17_plen_258_part_00